MPRLTNTIRPRQQCGRHLRVLALLLVGFLLLASCDQTDTSSQTTSAGPTTTHAPTKLPTSAPAKSPTPTRTPGPHLVTGATFGGPEAAFTSKFGSPTFSESNVRHYQFTTSDGISVLLVITLDDTDPPSSDGKQHINGIGIQPPDSGTTWSATTANKVVALLLPSDANHTKDEQVQDIGLVHVYLSADLALTFPASAFVDIQTSQPLTPGTFSYECNSSNGLHGGCNFTVGA